MSEARLPRFPLWLVSLWLISTSIAAQVVDVSLSLATNQIVVGGTTMLTASAQIRADQRGTADRIFSWYVDLVNAGAVARLDSANLQKPAADNDPAISGRGVVEGANVRGIYDTFMNLPGAGRDAPVVLFAIPVTGLALGKTEFHLQPGSRISGLMDDFLVAPAAGGDPLTGGEYTLAVANLDVVAPDSGGLPPFPVSIALAGAPANRVRIAFPVTVGWNYFVETRADLATGSTWQQIAGGPFNSGQADVAISGAGQFFRVKAIR